VPSLKRRNRIVIFRLTEEEYASLKVTCADRGARSVSDFARSALLSSIEAGDRNGVSERLTELQSSVRQMSELLERIAGPCVGLSKGETK